jgi:hypothetical protein
VNAISVARVIDAHTPTGSEPNITCWCNERFGSWAEHAMHVAPLILASLDLREQWGVVTEDVFGDETPDDYADDQAHAKEIAAERCQSCDHCRNALPKHVVRRFVSGWQPIGEEKEKL